MNQLTLIANQSLHHFDGSSCPTRGVFLVPLNRLLKNHLFPPIFPLSLGSTTSVERQRIRIIKICSATWPWSGLCSSAPSAPCKSHIHSTLLPPLDAERSPPMRYSLFGFDTGTIGSITTMESFIDYFGEQEEIVRGLVVAIILLVSFSRTPMISLSR